ncbi:MAG TPA: sigma-70 family RNA polymerase sigma factor [Streptosporangiaceae bacterium]|nr:sigma-70 family RNA polymerase sigma factor [Streptosporangiaceae bacterium]
MAETDPRAAAGPESDAELIKRARAGDATAYGALYERHAEAARRLARTITGNQADSDDVVAETFARVLSAMRNGNGPDDAFRPYLLTALRRVAFDQVKVQRRQIPTEDSELPDPGEPFADPVIEELDRSLVARAFKSLPERWSAVLWHTEIEQSSPAEVATILGLSANGVAALRYRAREGLRQAYLQLHLADRATAACRPFAEKLAIHVRGKLSRRQAREVEAHLKHCRECTEAYTDLTAINSGLRGMLAPVAAAGAVASGTMANGAIATARAAIARFLSFLGHRPVLPITAAAAAVSVAIPAFTLVHSPHQHLGAAPARAIIRTHSTRGNTSAGRSPASARQPSPSEFPTQGKTPAARQSTSPRPEPTSRTSQGSPAPTGTPTPTPASPTPTTSAPTTSASPTPRATVKVTARLSVGVNVAGVLDLGVTALVKVDVSDPGNGGTGQLTATVTLPPGIALLGLTGSGSWSCGTGNPMTCTHAPVAAGASANLDFNVLVVTLSGCGDSVTATVLSGDLSATGSSPGQVACPLL